jgi:hypothetical protein
LELLKDEIGASFSLFKGTLYRRCGEYDLAEENLLELTGNIKFASKRNIQLTKLYVERCEFTKAVEIAKQAVDNAASVDSDRSWCERLKKIRELNHLWEGAQFKVYVCDPKANSNRIIRLACLFLKEFQEFTGGPPKAVVYTAWEASLLSNERFLDGVFGATATRNALPPHNFEEVLELNLFDDPRMTASFLEARVLSVSKLKKVLATIGLRNGLAIDDKTLDALKDLRCKSNAISSLLDLYSSTHDTENASIQMYKKLLNQDVSFSADWRTLAESFCLSQLSGDVLEMYVASKWRLACFEGRDEVVAFFSLLKNARSEDIGLDFERLENLQAFEALRCSCNSIVSQSFWDYGKVNIFLNEVDASLQPHQSLPAKKVEACLLSMRARVLTAQAEKSGDETKLNMAKDFLLKALSKRSNFVDALLAGGHLYTVQCIRHNNANLDPVESCAQAMKLYSAALAAICDQKKNNAGILDAMLEDFKKLFELIESRQKNAIDLVYRDLAAAAVGCRRGSSPKHCAKSLRSFKVFLSPECKKFQETVREKTEEQRGNLFKQLNNICTFQNGEEGLF